MTTTTGSDAQLKNDIDFLNELAAKPLDQRKLALSARIRKFLGKSHADAKADIAILFEALGKVDQTTRDKVVKARTEVILEIPGEHRKTLMGLIKEIAADWSPRRKEIEKQAVMNATQDYFFLKRMMVRMKFRSVLA